MTDTRETKLCLVEDDPIMGESLTHRFTLEGVSCDWHQTAEAALSAMEETGYGALVSDIRLPDMDGEEMFNSLLEQNSPPPPAIFITGYGSIDQAVRLLKLGARDYITKPFDLDELLAKLHSLCPEIFIAPGSLSSRPVLGISPVMRNIQETLMQIAQHDAGVVITGESGVGKEYAAQYLHRCVDSGRERPFIAVNCAALPENLLEAEMFGYEKGAFTGAERRHRGVFERAHGGTLFLDEIGEMSGSMQAKLLRAIQEGIIHRIGSEETVRVDVRLVCATNRDLRKMVSEGGFREDLYYRINVIHVPIPPLRERKEDILWFARRFMADSAHKHSLSRYFTPIAERYLVDRSWPGNLRELRHAIERACILARQETIGPKELGATDSEEVELHASDERDLKGCLQEYEENLIREALAAHRWHIVETADSLNISRKNLWEKMRKHGIDKQKSDGI